MAERIGRVEFIVDLDGKTLPQQARRLGKEIGEEGGYTAGDSFNNSFDKRLSRLGKMLGDTLNEQGRLAGERFSTTFDRELQGRFRETQRKLASILSDKDAFKDFASGFVDVDDAVKMLQQDLDRLTDTEIEYQDAAGETRRTQVLGERAAKAYGLAFRDMGEDLKRANADQEEAARKADLIRKHQERLEKSNNKLGASWKGLSHNTKQWTLIISAVAAGMQDIAVLGSAAGAGVLGLGGALTTALAGAGGFATVLTVLSKDLEELPPDLRRSATELQKFKDGFSDLGIAITRSAVAEMPDTFGKLERSTRALTPAFSSLGTSVGIVFDDMADGLAEGSAGFEVFEKTIENAAQDLPALANATGTWLTALGRGLNEANPLADQMVGYIQELGDRFDDFTQSDSFDVWIKNSMQTFTDLGELLDSTGRMLNDLVTPQAVERTQDFLDNLTDFMPHLGNLLDFAGRLDVFGLAAQLLAEWGDALEPLAEPMGKLADEVSDVASELITNFAPAIKAAASVIGPLVEGAADLIDALPPGAFTLIAGGVLTAVAAFKVLKGVQGIAGAAAAAQAAGASFGPLGTTLGTLGGKAETLSGKLAGWAGKAGLWGAAAAGVLLLNDAMNQAARDWSGIEDTTQDLVTSQASLKDALIATAEAADTSGQDVYVNRTREAIAATDDWGDALDLLGDGWARWSSSAEGAGRLSENLAKTLNNVSVPLATMAETNLPMAQEQFRAYADELGATDQQVLLMLEHMPEFKTVIDAASGGADGLTTSTELLEGALGRETTTMGGAQAALETALAATDNMTAGTNSLTGASDTLTAASETLTWATEAETAAMNINRNAMNKAQSQTSSLEGGFDLLTGQTNVLSFAFDRSTGEINSWSDGVFDARGASRDFQQAIDDATAAISENEKTLDTNEEAGRRNEAALDDLAQAALNNAEAIYRNTGSQKDSTQAVKDGRKALIDQLAQFGITGQAAEDYADGLGLIPADVSTAVAIRGAQAALGTIAQIDGAINHAARNRSTNIHVTTSGVTKVGNREITFARGGEVYGPTRALIGEAGPEAVVPLRRPLSQVDPSVRWLSAIAQGKSTPMASGGVAGNGRSITIEAGAIVVQGAEDPRRTAIEVMDRIAESATS